MAMNWIKVRDDLHEDPSVLWIAQQLKTRPETVVGYCLRFWGLVSRQTCDGCLKGVAMMSLENAISLPGFGSLLVRAGWLEYDDSDPEWPIIKVPKFERHLSEGAKQRALRAEQKRRERVAKTSDKCRKPPTTREEKRREESKELKFFTPAFHEFWSAYPARSGRKVGKQAAAKLFAAIEDQAAVVSAAANYAASKTAVDGYAKDPERFLKNGFWLDWTEYVKPESRVATEEDARSWTYSND